MTDLTPRDFADCVLNFFNKRYYSKLDDPKILLQKAKDSGQKDLGQLILDADEIFYEKARGSFGPSNYIDIVGEIPWTYQAACLEIYNGDYKDPRLIQFTDLMCDVMHTGGIDHVRRLLLEEFLEKDQDLLYSVVTSDYPGLDEVIYEFCVENNDSSKEKWDEITEFYNDDNIDKVRELYTPITDFDELVFVCQHIADEHYFEGFVRDLFKDI